MFQCSFRAATETSVSPSRTSAPNDMRAPQQDLVENAAPDRDLGALTRRQRRGHRSRPSTAMNSTLDNFPCGAARTSAATPSRSSTGQQVGFRQSPQTFSRGKMARSRTSVRRPAAAQNAAQLAPAGPLPTMATSHIFDLVRPTRPPLHLSLSHLRAAVEGKARSEQESARGAAQTGRVSDARPVRPRHLRGQSARSAETGRLLFHAVEDGGGRPQNARPARGRLGFRNAHRGERSRNRSSSKAS